LKASIKVTSPETAPNITVSNLSISPAEINAGNKVTLAAKVNNGGTVEGSYKVDLTLNSTLVESREVKIPGLSSRNVEFTVSPEVAGTYSVNLSGLKGTFSVTMPVSLASFDLSEVALSADKFRVGEKVTVSAFVNNVGDMPGIFTVSIKVNDRVVKTDNIALDGKSGKRVSYSISIDSTGKHVVNVNQVSMTVQVDSKGFFGSLAMWGLIGGIVLFIAVSIITVGLGMRKRRNEA
jgi:hypothetical protein